MQWFRFGVPTTEGSEFNSTSLTRIESLGLAAHLCQVGVFILETLSSNTLESTNFPTGSANHMNWKIQEKEVYRRRFLSLMWDGEFHE
ncbi:MAG: hypothetical protein AUI97_08150 [Crenarchaeota archaeon 13_1_40CM_3_52_17]|nr:MAG: hypothetical protein AUI97_08150 [Crenarchaeota archaeon 13_1_40CM_3_52_17]